MIITQYCENCKFFRPTPPTDKGLCIKTHNNTARFSTCNNFQLNLNETMLTKIWGKSDSPEAKTQEFTQREYPKVLANQNRLYKTIIKILLILCFLLFLFGGVARAQSNCKQWNGKHQQLRFTVVEGKIFGQCGSCGDLIPIRTDYSQEPQTYPIWYSYDNNGEEVINIITKDGTLIFIMDDYVGYYPKDEWAFGEGNTIELIYRECGKHRNYFRRYYAR